jgi:hypothetical protein
VTAATAAYAIKLYRDYDRLKDFKGPWLAPWTSFWLVRAVAGLQTHAELYDVCQKYGRYSNDSHVWLLHSIALDKGIQLVIHAAETASQGRWLASDQTHSSLRHLSSSSG